MNKKAVAYLRVSTDGQDTKSQRFKIEEFAKQNEYLIEDWFVDEAYSGALEERPELQRLEKWIPENEGKSVIMVGIDRLAREMYIFTKFKRLFEENNVTPIYLNFQPTGEIAIDTLIQNILASFADFERYMIFDRFNRGRMAKINIGKKAWGGPRKFGFKNRIVPIGQDRNDYYYEIKEDEAKVIRKIYKLFLTGNFRIQGLCRELSSLNLKNSSGSTKWSPTTVRGYLTDPMYFGEYHYGKTKTVGAGKRKREIPRAIEDQKIVQVPSIISRADFDRVQGILTSFRSRITLKQNRKDKNLLTGLIRCGKCHYRYTGWRRSSTKIEDKWFYYRCNSINQYDEKNKTSACGNPAIMGYQAEDIVWTELVKILIHPEKIWKDTSAEKLKNYENKLGTEAWEINKRLDKIKEERNRIFSYAAKGIFDEARVISGQNDLDKEEQKLKNELHEIIEKRVLLEYAYGGKPCIPQLNIESYTNADFTRKRELILQYVKEIIVIPSVPTKLLIVFNIPIKPVKAIVTTNKDSEDQS